MGQILIVSNAEHIFKYKKISEEYDAAFEINDFFNPDLLDNNDELENVINMYLEMKLPKGSTMHGVFYDILPFSNDRMIRNVAINRMRGSMKIAKRLGVKGVVFHTNVNPDIVGDDYCSSVVDSLTEVLKELLLEYPDTDIYLENMFDRTPDVLRDISERLADYPNYGVCLDWAHVNVYGENITSWVLQLKDYVRHIHINDNDLKNDHHWALGKGKIDWNLFYECYDRYFKHCSVVIETNLPQNQVESLEFLKEHNYI